MIGLIVLVFKILVALWVIAVVLKGIAYVLIQILTPSKEASSDLKVGLTLALIFAGLCATVWFIS